MREKTIGLPVKNKLLIAGTVLFAVSLAITVAVGRKSIVSAVVGGPTCNVPADYPTIQDAVNDVGCSTVKVAAGDYNESVTVARSVKIKGAKAGTQVKYRTFDSAGESTVNGATAGQPAFKIEAANVSINGFSITNPDEGLGILVKTAGDNAKIKNNIVDGVGGASFLNHSVGIYLEYGPDNVKVSGNKVNNIKSGNTVSPGTAQGIYIGDSTSSNPSLGIELDGNFVSDITSLRGAYGIQVNNGSSTSPTATGYTEVKIRGNKINNLSGSWAHGIGLEGETPNAVVRYNEIKGLTDINPTPVNDAIGVFFESNQFFFTANVNRNSLDVGPAAAGIAVHPLLTTAYPSLQVDGECNWWGHKSGPGAVASGTGSLVGPGVDYAPWLKTDNLNGRCGDKHKDDGHDNDDHHGDKDCRKDDRRDWHY